MDTLYYAFGLVIFIMGGILLVFGLRGLLHPMLIYSKVRARCIGKMTEQRGSEDVSILTYSIYRYEYKGTAYTFKDEDRNFKCSVGEEKNLWVRRFEPDIINKNVEPPAYVKVYIKLGIGMVLVSGIMFIIGACQ